MTSENGALNQRLELHATGLRKSFGGVEVLHGVDITVKGGEVLALLGENGAGKSTAIKILAGDYKRDAGVIVIDGEEADIRSPRDAGAYGLRVIYQEFSDAPDLTVAENLSLGRLPRNRLGLVDWAQVRRDARDILGRLGIDLPIRALVGTLGVAERQVLEIARALAGSARLLILDEPTSALTLEETDALFAFIERLKSRGVAIIYITHRLDEVERIADTVLVFRDGEAVAEGPVAEFGRKEMVEAMVGHELEEEVASLRGEGHEFGAPVLSLEGATSEGLFSEVDLQVREGELLSLFGRIGCGALELAEAIFGLREMTAGSMRVGEVSGQPASPKDAIANFGIGFVPIDRKIDGLLTVLNVAENLSVASWPWMTRAGLLPPRATAKVYEKWYETLDIRGKGGATQIVDTLSGGNQQKVVLGRWLERESKLLVLAEPTRGVDVGARAQIYHVLRRFADQGIAVLIVTSDIEEVTRISDTIVVMSRGRVVARHKASEVDRAQLIRQAAADTAEVAVAG